MIKRIFIFILMLGYLYTLTFDIFLNLTFKIPTPLLFGLPMIFLFGSFKKMRFLYGKEFVFFFISLFLYFVICQGNPKSFFINLIIFYVCGLYFNFFIGYNMQRLNQSVLFFVILLLFSGAVMLMNQQNPGIDALRTRLIGGNIVQSPTGIAAAIFTFGYQMAALTPLIFIYTLKFRWPKILQLAVFIIAVLLIYFGLQRSALVGFGVAVLLFYVFYYRAKAIFIFAVGAAALVIGSYFINVQEAKSTKYDNIFAKNERNAEKGEDRSRLVTENLEIYSNYPLGLMFYGKTWSDVIRSNYVFRSGITSHNAYLMFITYLGPFLGIGLLIALYIRIAKVVKETLLNIRDHEQPMLVCLCLAFISVTFNSFFHNAWLIEANGPTVFLFFAIMQLNKIQEARNEED